MEDLHKGYDIREDLKKVKAPSLILQGRQDPMPESVAIEIHGLLANSQLHFIERAGHFTWLEQPKEFFDTVHAFLGELQPAIHHH